MSIFSRRRSGGLEEVRVSTIAVVQNSAAVSEENLASVEEILAEIEKVNEDIAKIADEAKILNVHSQEMKESLGVFSL